MSPWLPSQASRESCSQPGWSEIFTIKVLECGSVRVSWSVEVLECRVVGETDLADLIVLVPVLLLTGSTAVPDQETARTPLDLLCLQAAPGAPSLSGSACGPQLSQTSLSPGRPNQVLDGGGSLAGGGLLEIVPDVWLCSALQEKRNKVVSVAEHSRVQRSPAQSECGF